MSEHCPFCCPHADRKVRSIDLATYIELCLAPLLAPPQGTRVARYSLQDLVVRALPEENGGEAAP